MINEKLEKCCIIDETLYYGWKWKFWDYTINANNEKLKNHIHPLCNPFKFLRQCKALHALFEEV